MNELQRLITSVSYQLYLNALLRCLLLAGSVFLLTLALGTSVGLALGVAALGLISGIFLTKMYQNKKPVAISLLHQRVEGTEYSLELLTKKELNLAEQLQLQRLSARAAQVPTPTVLFAQLPAYGALLLLALGTYYFLPKLLAAPAAKTENQIQETKVPQIPRSVAVALQSARLSVQPPAYTGLPGTSTSELNAAAIVGSQLTWRLQFNAPEGLSVRLTNQRGAEVPFRRAEGYFTYADRLLHSGLYALRAYRDDSLVYQSDYYQLEAQPDLPPKIEPASKELYQYHLLKDPKTMRVSARISDDFRVQQAFIVATLARGSGENVKFREVRFPLDKTNFKESTLTKNIDLKALGFAPGDELYYYWAALDNKQPEGNFTKSDTYFVVYKDTAQLADAELATMAVNVMPEYFRSQRQIIIDTEKLLARRKKISTKEFNHISNEIGFDQKVLRLRYGQFLGEEFETTIGGGNALPTDGEGDVVAGFANLKAFTHDSDHSEVEHDGHDHGHAHAHNHAPAAGSDDKDPLAALMEQYIHSHDDAETNTFYEQSTRSLLKMALEQMWQSELHLRMYEPEQALPYEQKALEYLKIVQQKSRAYVKKSGYDPPPLKEKEKRLTGELGKINPRLSQERRYLPQPVRERAAKVLGYLELTTLSAAQRQQVQQLGHELSEQARSSGPPDWALLGTLQKIASAQVLSAPEKEKLQRTLYGLVRGSDPSPTTAPQTAEPKLQQAFWRHLQ
ncbi:hypothetical protein GCM10027275_00890 [Rhabdobacter roseus]|uniref:DUF4175 domain-containing protein n=1 Tax=Rhabdobacter roseus TaxID=1655419 RepID=A0A840TL83_9BACT|nr:hypothetical protein [Rhabdobacter roseus]MBB5281973.1 hypothetical protein [Rhabdobacter roseus]